MTGRRASRYALRALASGAAAALVVASCTDLRLSTQSTIGSDPGDPVITDPSLATDIQPIFTARCAFAGCHITPTEANLRLVLTDAPTSFQNLVNAPSVEAPGSSLVVPGDAANSYLMFKLQTGSMPKTGPNLSPGTLATIGNWIDQGAQPN